MKKLKLLKQKLKDLNREGFSQIHVYDTRAIMALKEARVSCIKIPLIYKLVNVKGRLPRSIS